MSKAATPKPETEGAAKAKGAELANRSSALSGEDLAGVAGGINPQPLPPGEHSRS